MNDRLAAIIDSKTGGAVKDIRAANEASMRLAWEKGRSTPPSVFRAQPFASTPWPRIRLFRWRRR